MPPVRRSEMNDVSLHSSNGTKTNGRESKVAIGAPFGSHFFIFDKQFLFHQSF